MGVQSCFKLVLVLCFVGCSSLELPTKVKTAMLRGEDGTIRLDHAEASRWLGQHLRFMASQVGTDPVYDVADRKLCAPEPIDPDKVRRINDTEWSKIVEKVKTKFEGGIYRDLGDYGVIGSHGIELLNFEGLVEFIVTGESVRLVVRGFQMSNSDDILDVTKAPKCDSKTNALKLGLEIDSFTIIYRDEIKTKSFIFGESWEKQEQSTSKRAELTFRIAVDAALRYDTTQGSWVVNGKVADHKADGSTDVYVCVDDITATNVKFGNGFGITTVANMAIKWFGSRIRASISGAVYCAVKYTLKEIPFLKGLMDFSKNHADRTVEEGKPRIGFTVRNKFDQLGKFGQADTDEKKSAEAATKYKAHSEVLAQFNMPTMPFIEHVLQGASQTAEGYVGAEGWKTLKRTEAEQEKLNADLTAAGVELPSQKAQEGAAAAAASVNAMAEQLCDAENKKMAGIIKSAANLVFQLDNDLQGSYKGGFEMGAMSTGDDSVGDVHWARPVKFTVEKAGLSVHAKSTKIPYQLFDYNIMGGGAGELIRSGALGLQAVRDKEWKAVNDNALMISGDVTLFGVEDMELSGNLLSLIGDAMGGYRHGARHIRAGLSSDLQKEYFDALVAFLTTSKSLSLSCTNTLTADQKRNFARTRTGGETIQTVEGTSIDKHRISFGGMIAYTGPFMLDTYLKRTSAMLNRAAEHAADNAAVNAPRDACIKRMTDEYQQKLDGIKERKRARDLECKARHTEDGVPI